MRRRRQVRQVAPVEHEVIAEAGTVRIGEAGADGGLVAVTARATAAVERRRGRARPRPPRAARCQSVGVVLQPALEAEPAPQQSRRDARRDQCRFDHERARAAHRVVEAAALRARCAGQPAAQQQRRREVLLERRFDAGLAVAAAMQRLAAQVDADRDAFAGEPQVDAQVRRAAVDRGTRADCARASGRRSRPWRSRAANCVCAQPARRLADDVDRKRAVGAQVRLPTAGRAAPRYITVGVGRVDVGQRQQHAARRARMQAGEVGAAQRPAEARRRPDARDRPRRRVRAARSASRSLTLRGHAAKNVAVVRARGCVSMQVRRHGRPPAGRTCTRSRGRTSCSARPMMR